MLAGLYGNSEQKLQLHIFDTCADRLITVGALLRKHLKESDKIIDTYSKNAEKRKQACLREIKVIRDAEKMATGQDIKVWKTIIQDRLSSQLEGQNASAIQKTIHANFDINKTPLLAEQYATIVPNIYDQKNTGDTWPAWLEKNKKVFEQPNGIPGQQHTSNSIYQMCKDHWIVGSLTMAAVVAGIYYLWEQWNEEDEDTNKPAKKEESKQEQAATDQNKKNTTESAKNA